MGADCRDVVDDVGGHPVRVDWSDDGMSATFTVDLPDGRAASVHIRWDDPDRVAEGALRARDMVLADARSGRFAAHDTGVMSRLRRHPFGVVTLWASNLPDVSWVPSVSSWASGRARGVGVTWFRSAFGVGVGSRR